MSNLFQRSPAVEGVALDEQEVLFHQTTNRFVLLNPTARSLWGLLAVARTPAELGDALCAHHAVDRAAAMADADRLLAELSARQFVTVANGNAVAAAPAPPAAAPAGAPYHAPALRDLTEDEVLASFQMTAAEISAASCWWVACATGCP